MNKTISTPAPGLRESVRIFIENPRFDQAILALIVVNAITLGIEIAGLEGAPSFSNPVANGCFFTA
jgi:hypothetical protein